MADASQITVAEAVVDTMGLPEGFSTADLPNPHLQRHYQVLEAFALFEDPPGHHQLKDETLECIPSSEEANAAAAEFLAATLAAAGADVVQEKKGALVADDMSHAESFLGYEAGPCCLC